MQSKWQLRGINDQYLIKENCNAIKGIFILLILASHFANTYGKNYTSFLDTSYWSIRIALGQCVVAPFLFFSGYGVMLSVDQKGRDYIKTFPQKRILHTLLVYDCSQIIFLIFQLWCGKKYSIKQFLLSFFSWSSFGNDNWYIFVILCCYIISWLALKNGQVNRAAAMRITVGLLALTTFLMCAQKETYWYNTTLCYALGAWYYLYREKIETILKRDIQYILIAGIVVVSYIFTHRFWNYNVAIYELTACLFILTVVIITMKVQVRNRFLIYCGKHLSGLFLIHRLPMLFLGRFSVFRNHLYVFFALSVLMAFILEFGFRELIFCMTEDIRC